MTEKIRDHLSKLIVDSCQVENGGCGSCGICSHDPTTNAVKCTIKTGYTNTGYGSTIVCTGKATLVCFLVDVDFGTFVPDNLSSTGLNPQNVFFFSFSNG